MKRIAIALLVGALAVVPAAAFAANAQTTTAKHPDKAAGASHATTGVVKSIDETTLVITQLGQESERHDVYARSVNPPRRNGRSRLDGVGQVPGRG